MKPILITMESRRKTSIVFALLLWMLSLLIVLLFIQVWWDIAGITIRSEDLLIIFSIVWAVSNIVFKGKVQVRPSTLYTPLLFWAGIILLGAFATFFHDYSTAVKQDAVVNALRLIFATTLFLLFYNAPLPAAIKVKMFVVVVVIISLLTTAVSMLQIIYWSHTFPMTLPRLLIEFREGANMERGREIFALYIGDTATHTWSAALAFQAIVVWFVAWAERHLLRKWFGFAYFILLLSILVRTSVRNSLLGLIISLGTIYLLDIFTSKYALNRLVKPILILFVLLIGIFLLYTFGTEYYFTRRILQTIPSFSDGSLQIHGGSSIYGRFDYMMTAFNIFQNHFLWGSGFYSFETLSTVFGEVKIAHAHNSYMQVLAELGLIGFLAMMWLIIKLTKFLFQTYQLSIIDRHASLMWHISTSTLIFLLFTAFFANSFWSPIYISLLLIPMGILASVAWEIQPKAT